MAPTTITTIVLILFGLGLLALSAYGWLSSWEWAYRFPSAADRQEAEYEASVAEMRRAIADYEAGRRPL